MSQALLYHVTIRLEEDLHSGTGTGSESLDAIQITGGNGLPVIRATHIKGLLREAGRFLCEIGHYSEEDYKALFGEEGGWQRSALLMQSLRFDTQNQAQENWSHQWTSTSREINSRTPKENTLRTQEYVKAGSHFHGQWLLTQPNLSDFLRDCLQQVTHLGATRSRGGGRIYVESESFEKTTMTDNPPTSPIPNDGQTRLRLILRNLEPLCLPITGFPGNTIPSECYIRGQQLLGALVALILRERDQKMAEKLLAGKINIGHAYPLPTHVSKNCSQWMLLPFPLNIYHKKPEPNTPPEQPWWTQQTTTITYLGERGEKNKFQNEGGEGEKLKRPGNREFLFSSDEQDQWQRYQPKMVVHMRNQTPADKKGDKALNIAGENRRDDLFSEEEILEDTCFMSDILFSNSEEAKTFAETFNTLLNGQTGLSLGRGGRPVVVELAVWLEELKPLNASQKPKAEKLNILLTSDLIVRSETLGFYDSLDINVLKQLLGITNKTIDASLKVYKDTVIVRGFNYLTRLPKAPFLAIRRGSAFEITGSTEDINILRQALEEKTALGERAHEGFGRFKLDLPIDCKTLSPEKATPKLNSRIGQQEAILKAAKKLADEIGEKALSKTQWQYLRQQALVANSQKYIDNLLENLTEHKERKAGEAWKKPLEKIQKALQALQALTQSENDSYKNQILFLDALVRYQFARLKIGESKTT
ncbi:MAG: RAMP superfamily CRISPR-associated protein [Candidatus Parabeggiatoa sp.]|nr:RAMP superfamily CRISPR-associated protein [Candidatus Parabeggiatoa sp.]